MLTPKGFEVVVQKNLRSTAPCHPPLPAFTEDPQTSTSLQLIRPSPLSKYFLVQHSELPIEVNVGPKIRRSLIDHRARGQYESGRGQSTHVRKCPIHRRWHGRHAFPSMGHTNVMNRGVRFGLCAEEEREEMETKRR